MIIVTVCSNLALLWCGKLGILHVFHARKQGKYEVAIVLILLASWVHVFVWGPDNVLTCYGFV